MNTIRSVKSNHGTFSDQCPSKAKKDIIRSSEACLDGQENFCKMVKDGIILARHAKFSDVVDTKQSGCQQDASFHEQSPYVPLGSLYIWHSHCIFIIYLSILYTFFYNIFTVLNGLLCYILFIWIFSIWISVSAWDVLGCKRNYAKHILKKFGCNCVSLIGSTHKNNDFKLKRESFKLYFAGQRHGIITSDRLED